MDRDREVFRWKVTGDARSYESLVPRSDHGREYMEVCMPA